MREEFENLKYIKDKLYAVEYDHIDNDYIPIDWIDPDLVNDRYFIKGAWYIFQELHKSTP